MRIAVLGFGHVGSNLSRLLSATGHTIVVGLPPGSKSVSAAREQRFEVLPPDRASSSAAVVILALPWQAAGEACASLRDLDGQIVVDAMNPLDQNLRVLIPEAGSAAQQVAAWLPRLRVAKAFNTIGAQFLGNPSFDMYYCCDHAEAGEATRQLIEDTGMRPVSVGPLSNAGYLEQLAGLWIDLAARGRVQGAFGFNLVRERV